MNQNEIDEMLNMLRRDYVPFDVETLRDRLAMFLSDYQQLDQCQRVAIRSQLRLEHSGKMLRIAQELAVRAVRQNSANDLVLGLLAVALEGLQSDFRNTIVSLCLLYHSAKKLGVDPAPLFNNASAYGTQRVRDFMLQYLQRGEKDIRAMAMEETYGPDGFDYTVIPL